MTSIQIHASSPEVIEPNRRCAKCETRIELVNLTKHGFDVVARAEHPPIVELAGGGWGGAYWWCEFHANPGAPHNGFIEHVIRLHTSGRCQAAAGGEPEPVRFTPDDERTIDGQASRPLRGSRSDQGVLQLEAEVRDTP